MADETSTYPVDTDALYRRIEELQARLSETPAPAHGPGPGDDFYRRLIDLSPDAIFVHDKDHKIVFVNPAGVSQFGADSPDQVIGKDTTQLVHLDSREHVWARIRDVERQALEPGITEQRRLRLDGTDYYAEVAATAVRWRGEAAALITVRDITARKLAEAALRENERRVTAITKNMPGAVYQRVLSPGGIMSFTFISSGVRSVLGIEAEDAIKNPHLMFQAINPQHRERFKRNLIASASDLSPFDMEFPCTGPGGRKIWVRSTADTRRLADGTVVWDGLFIDITEQKRAEQHAGQAYRWLRDAIASMPEAFVLWDQNDRLVLWNDKFLSNYAKAGALLVKGTPFRKIAEFLCGYVLDENGQKAGPSWLETRLQQHRDARGAHLVALSDGRWVKVTERHTPEQFTVGVITDMTEHVKNQEILRESMEQAELANRAKTEFLANMSHELRTPLNAIIGFSDIMESELYGPLGCDEYKGYIHDIKQSGTHLHEVINDILDLSKIEAGKLELNEEVIEPESLIERCLRVVKSNAETGGIELSTEFKSRLPKIRADERKFKQILINLLSNAVKFTEQGGRVDVVAEIDDSRGLVISITDTGIGIAAEDIPVVMMPFGQADRGLARKYEGTGLGMPLTKLLVELHGGVLELKSVLGEGTTVTVNFPPDRVIAET